MKNVKNIKISPVAVSQDLTPAGTTDDSGDLFSTISISDLFALVKEYDKAFTPKPSSVTLTHRDLLDRYEKGEISKDEYLAEICSEVFTKQNIIKILDNKNIRC